MDNQNDRPIISVIVPVYNVESYLPRCIESILNQSFTNFELILVDDGSPDNCPMICDDYAKKDTRVTVIHQVNAGISAARNAGLEIASGEWIAFLDSDDWIHKDYLKILLSGVLKDTDIVICDCVMAYDNIESTDYNDVYFYDASLEEINNKQIVRTRVWGRLYRKNIMSKLRFISGTEPAEDACFNELLYFDTMQLRITDAKLYYYYMRPDSAIHTHLGRGLLNSIDPFLEKLTGINDSEKRKRIIMRCYKSIFSARYGEMYTDDYSIVKNQCEMYLKKLSFYYRELDLKNKIIIYLLRKSPFIYRLFRILNDPSLIEYEKNQKRLKQERKRIV